MFKMECLFDSFVIGRVFGVMIDILLPLFRDA